MKSVRKIAFTLAEVLVTLTIIGMVYDMTIPTLISNVSARALSTQKTVAAMKFQEAMSQMQMSDELMGYNTAEDFMKVFKTHMKISSQCSSDKLQDCLIYESITDDSGNTIDVSKMGTSKKIVTDTTGKYPANTVGFQIANGITGVLTYRKDCKWKDPLSVNAGGTESLECLAMIYDVNGAKKPNKINKDIILLNAKLPDLCTQFVEGVCGTYYTTISNPVDCTNTEGEDYQYCEGSSLYNKDYWAGAAKLCGGIDNMLNYTEFEKIVKNLYGEKYQVFNAGSKNLTKAAEIGLENDELKIWRPGVYDARYGYYYSLSNTGAITTYSYRYKNSYGVICVER